MGVRPLNGAIRVKRLGAQTLRWALLAIGLVACLYFLNDAAFSGWMAGGPPGPHKGGWEFRAQSSLLRAVGALLLGIAAFRAVKQVPNVSRTTWAVGALALFTLLAPLAQRALAIDKCLDSGGKWSPQALECAR